MDAVIKELKYEGFERIVKFHDEKESFVGYIVIHDTTKGPALGGCRIWPFYKEKENALLDACALAEAMSYKNAMAELPYGGGKTAIFPNSANFDKKKILETAAYAVDYLQGCYIIAEDVNVSCDDLDIVREITPYVVKKNAGDPGPVTAKGVYYSLDFYRKKYLSDKKCSLALQGIGSVGRSLLNLLLEDGNYDIVITDIKYENLSQFENVPGVRICLDPEEIFDYEVDIFSPCALGGVIDENVANKIKCKAIIGSANNPVKNFHALWKLHFRKIDYLPDFVVNSGGVIQVAGYQSEKGYDPSIVEKKLKKIPVTLEKIMRKAKKLNLPYQIVALRMAREKIMR